MPIRHAYLLDARRLPLVLAALALLAPALAACRSSWTVENREVPVHVWLTVPVFEEPGGVVDALIYVGSEKAIEGPVRFPPGVKTMALPTLYMMAGSGRTVSAVFEGGAISGTEEVKIGAETWVQIVLRDRTVTINGYGAQP